MSAEKPSFAVAQQITFPLGNQDITVSAANIGTLAALSRVLMPLFEDLADLPADVFDRAVGSTGPSREDVMQLLRVLMQDPDVPLNAVAVATGMHSDAVGLLMPDEFAYLFAVVVQVNADFFARALPTMRVAAGKFGALRVEQASVAPNLASPTKRAGRNASTN